jgi:hypothetical protein
MPADDTTGRPPRKPCPLGHDKPGAYGACLICARAKARANTALISAAAEAKLITFREFTSVYKRKTPTVVKELVALGLDPRDVLRAQLSDEDQQIILDCGGLLADVLRGTS